MKTKTIFVLLLGLLNISLWPAVAGATPPRRVVPEYDLAAQTMSVTIDRWTLIRSLHYIKTVEIKLNGKPYLITQYDTQPGNTFTYTYKVAAAPGDILEVTARCNLWGSKTGRITVAKPGLENSNSL